MALDTPLNTKQLDVLRWISEGCREGRWADRSYKTSAVALQTRRLVTISKRGGWTATIEPAGTYYLQHGDYPADHFPNKRRSYQRLMRITGSEAGTAQKPLTRPAPDELTPTRKLLKDIADAGGVLQLDTHGDKTNYGNLVAIVNRRRLAPDGQQVILMRGSGYHNLILRLSSVSAWQTDAPSAVVAAARIGRWHPAVAALRAENRLTAVTAPHRQRTLRLLHALAREAEARDYPVAELRHGHHRGYTTTRDRLAGYLVVDVAPIHCSVGITQRQDRVPHEPTREELEKAQRESWYRIPRHDYVPSERLSITIDTDSRYSSAETWSDTKTIPLETRLPDVMTMFERWALVHAERTEAERLAAIEQQKRRDREDELARQAYIHHALEEKLRADLEAWELTGRLRNYLTAMRDRVDQATDEGDRAAGNEWLSWCEQFVSQLNPLNHPISTPTVRPPSYSDIADFRKRLGIKSTDWY